MAADEAPADKNNQGSGGGVNIPKIGVELSQVASNPKQSIAILIAAGLVAVYLVWGIMSESDTDKAQEKKEAVLKPQIISKPTSDMSSSEDAVVPALPKAPDLKDPTAPPPPPPEPIPVAPTLPLEGQDIGKNTKTNDVIPPKAPPPVVATPAPAHVISEPLPMPPKPSQDAAAKATISRSVIPKVVDPEQQKAKAQRQKSSIILVGGAPAKSQEKIEQSTLFKKKSTLTYVLGQGKIIDAVLETAINTDMATEVRAVISRDVYSESGKIILIPKGTRVFGSFSSGVDGTYGRVNITWDRIDLPSGYILTLQGTAVDHLGRRGSEGRLDTKIKEKITNNLLSTALNVAFAGALDKLVKPETQGTQAAQGMAVATNLQQAVQTAYSGQGTDAEKINAMCTAATNAVPDATNPAYAQVQTACNTARTAPAASSAQTLQTLFNTLMSASNTSIAQTATTSTPTKQQEATKKGMEDFSKMLEDIAKRSEPKPTVTIDQGTHIKIYVNRDYSFPKEAVTQSRIIQ